MRRIAILGGGISGLTALDVLARAQRDGAPAEVLLLEATDRLGGLIRTERVEGFVVEAGPDSFLTEKPEGVALATELGLGPSLIGSNDRERRTYILRRNRLVPLPHDWRLFIPRSAWSAIRPGLLPVPAIIATLSEPFRVSMLKRGDPADESVAAFVLRHFGRGMLENIAAPLLAGIYGGDTDRLSAKSVLPRFVALERKYGSLVRGIAKMGASAPEPVFTTLCDGMEQLVKSLVGRAKACPRTRIQLGTRAAMIEPHSSRAAGDAHPAAPAGYMILTQDGTSVEADAIILALPAFESARLVRMMDAGLAAELEAIPYTSAVIMNLAYPVRPENLPQGFGFLAPPKSGRRVLACTFVHNKFRFRTPKGAALLRCFLGGAQDPGILQLNDQDLTSLVLGELREMLGIQATPGFILIDRFPQAMPQYVVGHEDRVNSIWAALGRHPGLFLAGNSYSGIGLSDSIRTAKSAAENALAWFRSTRA